MADETSPEIEAQAADENASEMREMDELALSRFVRRDDQANPGAPSAGAPPV